MANPSTASGIKRFLPRIGSPGYHLMLACVAILILGPLGGISAAFMNFSIGFFISGQVLAGMLGIGVGMLYTPVLVDRMQLAYPSGYAVANILRALTDKTLLKRSIAKLGGGTLTGFLVGVLSLNLTWLGRLGFSKV